MNIALIAHDNRKELMTQFCTAYLPIFAKHTLCATGATADYVSERTGLMIQSFMLGAYGGSEQIGARIAQNEIDLVFLFHDPSSDEYGEAVTYISRLCDWNKIPLATNSGTAEALIMALNRGDMDWRNIVNPKK